MGRLELDTSSSADITIFAENLLVYGSLYIGTEDTPWPSTILASIILSGTLLGTPLVNVDEHNDLGNKVLAVFGDLKMVGTQPNTAWLALKTTANPGDTALDLTSSVDWKIGDEIILTSTEYSQEAEARKEHESLTITGVTGSIITVSTALKFRHFAGTVDYGGGTVRLAAHVGHITRSIVVAGNIDPTYWQKQYGAHIVAGQIDYAKTEQCDAIRLLGSIIAIGVQFKDVAKHNTDQAALYFSYRDVDSTNAPNNTISGCSIDAWNPAIVSKGTYGMVITNNVISRTYDVGIDVDQTSAQSTIDGNLLVGNRRSPAAYNKLCTFDSSCRYQPFAAMHLWNAHLRSVKGNVVAGSDDTGIVVRCLSPTICPIFLPHFRLHEVFSLHMCVLLYKYRKILEMLLKLMKLCEIMGSRHTRLTTVTHKKVNSFSTTTKFTVR